MGGADRRASPAARLLSTCSIPDTQIQAENPSPPGAGANDPGCLHTSRERHDCRLQSEAVTGDPRVAGPPPRGHTGDGTGAGAAAMKLNERSLAFYATCDAPVDNAGFLHKRGGRGVGSHRRWFVLRGNMLFYFEAEASREPLGVILLEGCTVELVDAREEFAFAVRFAGGRSRPYVLAADSQAALEGWVKALSRASFHYLRLVVRELEQQLAAMRERGPTNALPANPSPVSNPRPKENGRAVWSTLPEQPAAAPQRPPLPPRRRASAAKGSLATFAQLHERYGLEVQALRNQWRGRQAGLADLAGLEDPWLPSGSGGIRTQTQDQP